MQRKWKRRCQRLTKLILVPAAAVTGLLLFLSAYNTALANPTGGTVTNGSAAITTSGATTTVNQISDKAILNWQSFSVNKGEIVTFLQPGASSIALNRVIGSNPSAIYGTVSANGKVFLINPNGVLFAPGSQVSVGSLVASTLDIKDSDFVNGKYTFRGTGKGSVVNQGTIRASGQVVFLGSQTANQRVIVAQAVGLGAGKQVSLDFDGDSLLSFCVDTGAVGGSAVNTGTITANGGLVAMTAGTKDALLSTVVNNSGIIQAHSIHKGNGIIRLEGNSATNSGTLDVSGKASGATGGTIKLLGDDVTVNSGSTLDASGNQGGGTVLLGGAYEGGGSDYTASHTTVANGAVIRADALTAGNGGQVVVWAKDSTRFAGTITAQGGSLSGDGGSVETSGKQTLTIADSAKVSTTAANGKTGNWLLDPNDFTIADTGGNMTPTALDSALNANDVTVTTTGGTASVTGGSSAGTAGGSGDININGDVTWNSAHKLTLSAYNNINLNANITASGDNAGLILKTKTNTANNPTAGNSVVYKRLSDGSSTSITLSGSNQTFNLNGTDYTIINNLTALQDINGYIPNRSGNYVLGVNINAASSATLSPYTDNGTIKYYGFQPIGDAANPFTGTFDGLGHTINALTITRATDPYGVDTGLFGYINNSSLIRNVGLNATNITGGNPNCFGGPGGSVGGLVGHNDGGTITNSYNTGRVTGCDSSGSVGGLVGYNYGTITNSYNTGEVTTGTGSNNVGGLAGCNDGTIMNAYSTGNITSGDHSNQVGGLVGYTGYYITIQNVYSTGAVTVGKNGHCIGGLAGNNDGTLTNAYSTGAVTSGDSSISVGGLLGHNDIRACKVTNAYSTGAVTGGSNNQYVGGLVGWNELGTITKSYSTGNVASGDSSIGVGGLVGGNGDTIMNAYSTGKVTSGGSSNSVGGLVGLVTRSPLAAGIISNSFWDKDKSGMSSSSGSKDQYGLSTESMKKLSSFSSWGNDISASGSTDGNWLIYDGHTYPLLCCFLTPITVSADSISKTYDGQSAAAPANVKYSFTPNFAHLQGILSYGDNVNVGTYGLTGLFSDQQGYAISYSRNSTLTIN